MFSTLIVRVQTRGSHDGGTSERMRAQVPPDGESTGQIRSARPRRGRAGQLNPADLWSRCDPGATCELRDHDNLVGLRAPVALRDLELDSLSLFEGAVAIRLDR